MWTCFSSNKMFISELTDFENVTKRERSCTFKPNTLVKAVLVPPQNWFCCRESSGKILFRFSASISTHKNTRLWAQTTTTSKGWSKGITILLSTLWSLQIQTSFFFQIQHYRSPQGSDNLNSHSFFFFFWEESEYRRHSLWELQLPCYMVYNVCLDIKRKKRIKEKIWIFLINCSKA